MASRNRVGASLDRAGACAALVCGPLLLSGLAGEVSLAWAAAGGALVAVGLGAIRLTRGRWLSAPFLMLLLCTAGMAVGIAVDRQVVGGDALAGLCLNAPRSFIGSALHHWQILPATHVAMLLGGLATIAVVEARARAVPGMRCRKAICGRTAFNLMCNTAMLSGMLLGGWLGPGLALTLDAGWGLPAMLAMMMVGMVWGMAGSMALYRTGFAVLDHLRSPTHSPVVLSMPRLLSLFTHPGRRPS